MKFGKEFRTHLEETLPEWRDKFLCYKPLKKLLKTIPTTADSLLPPHDFRLLEGSADVDDVHGLHENRPLMDLQEWFVRILNEELEKFNDFYVDKEEEFVIRLQELKERIEQVKEKSIKGGVLTSESEFSEEMMDIRKDFVAIHGEMVLLKNYSSLNFAGIAVTSLLSFLLCLIWVSQGLCHRLTIHGEMVLLKNYCSPSSTGLVKILKKYDKRTGGLLSLPFTQLALNQPFFTTEPLTRLVRECEANLELLFPLEAEVIESTPTLRNQTNQLLNDLPNLSSDTPSSLGEETGDIYRSTLAAMKAIRGLRKASSTCNPLSFASFFGNQDDESAGAVTAENSASNSFATLQSGEEADQEDANSRKQN